MSLQTISSYQNNQFIVWAIFQSKNTKHYLLLFHNVEYFWGPPYLTNIIFFEFWTESHKTMNLKMLLSIMGNCNGQFSLR